LLDERYVVSLRAPSVIGLVGILQQQGALSYAQLLEFVHAVQARHSGPVVFQLAQGRIRTIEVQPSKRQQRLQHD
jgi:hypothetical protein